MDRDELRGHIHAATPRAGKDAGRLAALIFGGCWPGGPEDRTQRMALDWLRQWRPDKIVAELPACSCKTGRCVLCN